MQSRCTKFRFAPLKAHLVVAKVKQIAHCEDVELTEDGLAAALKIGNGDMRKILNIVQSTALAHGNRVCEDSVYRCTGMPTENDIRKCQNALLNLSVEEATTAIRDLQVTHSLALMDILTALSELLVALQLPARVRIVLVKNMAEVEYALASGASEQLQLGALVGMYFQAREELSSATSQGTPMEVT